MYHQNICTYTHHIYTHYTHTTYTHYTHTTYTHYTHITYSHYTHTTHTHTTHTHTTYTHHIYPHTHTHLAVNFSPPVCCGLTIHNNSMITEFLKEVYLLTHGLHDVLLTHGLHDVLRVCHSQSRVWPHEEEVWLHRATTLKGEGATQGGRWGRGPLKGRVGKGATQGEGGERRQYYSATPSTTQRPRTIFLLSP